MFQLDWSATGSIENSSEIPAAVVPYNTEKISAVQFTFWAEHCLECTPPQCYKSCGYYLRREDGRCRRTEAGQQPVAIPGSILGYGVRVKFRPWAKLETYLFSREMTAEQYESVSKSYRAKVKLCKNTGALNVKRVLNSANYFFITRSKWRTTDKQSIADNFLLELWSYEQQPYRLLIESNDAQLRMIARESVIIQPGFNSHLIPYDSIAPDGTSAVRFYPENNLEAEMLIVNAEFVRLKQSEKSKPAKRVKCVAWDLDNTLWQGILSETKDASDLRLRPGVVELIKALDERGIIQTIVSKNDYEPAWAAVEALGLSEYFLYPAINWVQKSQNLRSIAKELNIGIDSFAMIDDSAFERGEISAALPQVRVYDENSIDGLLSLPEFDVPATEEAAHRREMYRTEAKRKNIMAEWGGDYLDFIRSCNIEVVLGDLSSEEVRDRCYELVNRTNQLNISGHRYSREEFNERLSRPDMRHIHFSCRDKFGSYGIVGYLSMTINGSDADIDEFVVSCRIAQKHVEHAVMSWIARNVCAGGAIAIRFRPTERNTPMRNCLRDIGFTEKDGVLTISASVISDDDGIIAVSGTENA